MEKHPLKIVFLSDDFPPHAHGGAGMIAHEEATSLAEKGHHVVVITTTTKKEQVGENKNGNLWVRCLYSNYNSRWRAYVSLYNKKLVKEIDTILKKEKPDIIHAHNIHTHISYKILDSATKYTDKVFMTAHDAILVHYGKFLLPNDGSLKMSELKNLKEQKFRYNPFRQYFIRRYVKKVKEIFAVSKALKLLLDANGVPRVRVLHNGINESFWGDADPSLRSALISKYDLLNKKVILFAGRLSGLKGGAIIIDIFKKVHAEMPNARLLCVGMNMSGELQAQHAGIIFTGAVAREEMKYVYSISDVVAVPSLYLDPFPTVNLEAMACGKPVVGTTFGGTKEAVSDGETGSIVDPNDKNLFAAKILELLLDTTKAQEFGSKGRERFHDLFSKEVHVNALLARYMV